MRIRSIINTIKRWYRNNVVAIYNRYESWRFERDVKRISSKKRRFVRNKDTTYSEFLGDELIRNVESADDLRKRFK